MKPYTDNTRVDVFVAKENEYEKKNKTKTKFKFVRLFTMI